MANKKNSSTKRRKSVQKKSGTKKRMEKSVLHNEMAIEDAASWGRASADAISSFDFESAAKNYERLGINWILPDLKSGRGSEERCPTADEVREEVVRLIKEVIKGITNDYSSRLFYCETGCLSVQAHRGDTPDENWIWIGQVVEETLY